MHQQWTLERFWGKENLVKSVPSCISVVNYSHEKPAWNGLAPQYITDLIQIYRPPRALRSEGQLQLVVPTANRKTKGDRAFSVVGPKLWNALPLHIQVSSLWLSSIVYLVQIHGQADNFWKCWLLHFASKRKEAELKRGVVRRDGIWDRLVFSRFQDSLGGRVRMMLTGAAPVSTVVLTFIRAAVGCQVYEGYGQTECTAGCTVTIPGDWSAGHVGPPLPCNCVKLVDVPEMSYYCVNNEGEVCVKGPNVFQGYLQDPVKTSETIDADGWLHTGDIGKWLPNGTLQIVDRKKHIFKMSQGEYIAPEKVENVYVRSEAVSQVFVHGDSLQASLVAVVVPDSDFLSGWTKKKLGLDGSYQELCSRTEVKEAILDEMQAVGREGGLKSFEQVKNIYLHTEMFSVENGLLTPTMKSKRKDLLQFFRPHIEKLYASVPK
ncbi:long-chain-fatty-acid--CoA ligase 1-like [Gouania willdenowi]|uniref:long-chain-fatty-acid--CoA ligase 1-like n=1 Tax=Gouania willdenowi TaxID=441366 RepID=UPI0010553453|nr:long-chain-fatty-acid--CoA ligase 1-like [Gouania willdenowi]